MLLIKSMCLTTSVYGISAISKIDECDTASEVVKSVDNIFYKLLDGCHIGGSESGDHFQMFQKGRF